MQQPNPHPIKAIGLFADGCPLRRLLTLKTFITGPYQHPIVVRIGYYHAMRECLTHNDPTTTSLMSVLPDWDLRAVVRVLSGQFHAASERQFLSSQDRCEEGFIDEWVSFQ